MPGWRWPRWTRLAKRLAGCPTCEADLCLGFLTGQEMDWLEAMRILRERIASIGSVCSQYSRTSPRLMRAKLDWRPPPEPNMLYLTFKTVPKNPRSHHAKRSRLASHEAIRVQEIVGETFISVSNTPCVAHCHR